MYRIVEGSIGGLGDVEAFVERLGRLDQDADAAVRGFLDVDAEVVVGRGPGRLDLMGGIADYSGALVLQLPLREATLAAVQPMDERRLELVSLGAEANGREASFGVGLDELMGMDYAAARAFFGREPGTAWAGYVAGVFLVLGREKGMVFERGARVLVDSAVPEGKGVSSSAALEVAVMQAVAGAFELKLEGRELALLCQKVENLVVGAPCGIMDQMSSACGKEGQLLSLLCQPAELLEPVALPAEISVWGLDSGIRHAVSGADYGSVRVGAFIGYRMIAAMMDFAVSDGEDGGPVTVEDPRWGGYLANIAPSLFDQHLSAKLSEHISGADFLQYFGNTTDAVTQVERGRQYAVRVPTGHPVYEHHRVQTFAALLAARIDRRQKELLGELMYQSHASYGACGLGSEGTDDLVARVRALGAERGLYGAKITGGGSGGTVAVLGDAGAGDAVEEVAASYAQERGHTPYVFCGSSPGAVDFGVLRLEPVRR